MTAEHERVADSQVVHKESGELYHPIQKLLIKPAIRESLLTAIEHGHIEAFISETDLRTIQSHFDETVPDMDLERRRLLSRQRQRNYRERHTTRNSVSETQDSRTYLTVQEVANAARMTAGQVRQLLRFGRLQAEKTGLTWRINKESADSFLSQRATRHGD